MGLPLGTGFLIGCRAEEVNQVAVVDLATERLVATVKAGRSPWGVAIKPRGMQDD